MITRLSAFVFGSSPSDDPPSVITQKAEVEAVNNTSPDSNTLVVNAHDQMRSSQMGASFSFDENRNQEDWVFIDVLNKNVDIEPESSEAVKMKEDVALGLVSRSSQSPPATPNSADSDASGWLVTPPACFVTRRPLPPIAASPMDNLLIEHPSMSVYVSPEASISGDNSTSFLWRHSNGVIRNPQIDAVTRAGVITGTDISPGLGSECGDDGMGDTAPSEAASAQHMDSVNGQSRENSPPARQNNRQANAAPNARNNRSGRGNNRVPNNQVIRQVPHESNSPPWLLSRQAFRRMSRPANNKGKRGPPLFQPKPCGMSR